MFTGLIETTGRVTASGTRLEIESGMELSLERGHSLCVNGSCLTVISIIGRRIAFDVSPETAGRIRLPGIGEKVNLERSLEASGRLHGHFVTGHVDCGGTVLRIRRLSAFSEVSIGYPSEYRGLLVEKGSVAVSGISLTVSALEPGSFTVALIPETLEGTTAGGWKPGVKVNLEFDIIGKYVARTVSGAGTESSLRKYLEKQQHTTR